MVPLSLEDGDVAAAHKPRVLSARGRCYRLTSAPLLFFQLMHEQIPDQSCVLRPEIKSAT